MDTIRSFALFQRIFEYLDTKPDIQDTTEDELVVSKGTISFNDVSFAYNKEEPTLVDVNFEAYRGKMTALVGSSGAGKTTITNLLTRLYDSDFGDILIDNQNIRDISTTSLRQNIGIVTQEPYLFNGTISENISYGSPSATRDDIVSASKSSYIHDFIMTLPNGYDTVVGNRGVKLSGGQKQRISIARVLLKNPSILILDEATSALDSVSESYVQKAMVSLLKNRTSIVIAHRLSTIQNADQILVLDKGKIVENGTHHELLAAKGSYFDLYTKQFTATLPFVSA